MIRLFFEEVANDAGNVLEDEGVVIEPPVGPIKHQRLDRLFCVNVINAVHDVRSVFYKGDKLKPCFHYASFHAPCA